MKSLTECLVKTCSSKNLFFIAAALDCFYEIFSESNYNYVLAEFKVIELMSAGEQTLHHMYHTSKKNKVFAPHELDTIENALENVRPFVDYKKKEMKMK